MTRWEAIVSTLVAALCLAAVLLLPEASAPRVAAALILLLFLPGYVLLGLLLPDLGELEAWMRAFVSVGLSLVITSMLALGVVLFAVPWSIPLVPTGAGFFAVAMAIVSQTGGRRSAKRVGMRAHRLSLPAATLFLALGLSVLIGRAISPSPAPDPFTTFSVVGPDGSVESLPRGVGCDSSYVVTLQIRSHEADIKAFEVWQSSPTGMSRVYGPLRLQPEEGRDLAVEVTASTRERAPLHFELRTPGQSAAYRSLSLCAAADASETLEPNPSL